MVLRGTTAETLLKRHRARVAIYMTDLLLDSYLPAKFSSSAASGNLIQLYLVALWVFHSFIRSFIYSFIFSNTLYILVRPEEDLVPIPRPQRMRQGTGHTLDGLSSGITHTHSHTFTSWAFLQRQPIGMFEVAGTLRNSTRRCKRLARLHTDSNPDQNLKLWGGNDTCHR